MPELPEVETIRQDLRKKILGKKINDFVFTKKARLNKTTKFFVDFFVGNHFAEIDRIGKLIIFVLPDEKHVLLVHLKMTGQLIYKKDDKIIPGGHSDVSTVDVPNKHTHVQFHFEDGSKVFFNDIRRFGYLSLETIEKLEKIKSKYGIEPLTDNFTWENFAKIFAGKKSTILKALLLNQQIISGLGNIYVDETCFDAGIRPDRRVNTLTLAELKKLFASIKKIIKKAVEERGTTFNNYLDADGKKGSFVKFLKVYGRGGEECVKCKSILTKTKIGGRGTVYCEKCQS